MKGEKIFQKAMKENDIDCILLINTTIKDPNIYYFTQLDIEYCFVMIPRKGEPIFFVTALEYQRIKKNSKIKKVLEYRNIEDICQLLLTKKLKRIGINTNYITLAMFNILKKELKIAKFKAVEKILRNIRMIKTKEEINAIKKAAKIADTIFLNLVAALRNRRNLFKTEKDIAQFIEKEAQIYDTTISFETIVASGKNAAIPHYQPKKKPLMKGFCVLDFGIRYHHYISDMSRTIFFGSPTKEEKEVYNKVLRANLQSIRALKINKKCKDIDILSRKEFTYPHGLGHGIGIEVHESPTLSINSKDVIKENMCFTIEPGIYVPNKFGIRIEDDIWMKKEGPYILTKSTKELLVFPI